MIRTLALLPALLLAGASAQALAQTPPPAPAPAATRPAAPDLVVTIAVDQFSADLFAEYRQYFSGGLKRLSQGVVFPSGYQSHAATETCPGHSTILTGARPARSGIIANDWLDQSIARADKTVYCAEDENVAGSSSSNYTVSPVHLKVPTLGDRMKAANPASRVVSVSTKDRAAVMLGGHRADQMWWWNGRDYVGPAGQTADPAVAAVRASVAARLAAPRPAMELIAPCDTRARAVPIGGGKTVGDGRFARAAGDTRAFRASPESDAATVDLALALFDSLKLGRGPAPDLLALSASAPDYVGHTYGTAGSEQCLTLMALDRELGRLFAALDASGVRYVAVLTADHGGHDLPERNVRHAAPDAQRVDQRFDPKAIDAAIRRELKLAGPALIAQGGDLYVHRDVPARRRAAVIRRAAELVRQSPLVEAVFTGTELGAMPQPEGPPETWSLAARARASYFPGRSGDLIVALKPRVTPIADPRGGYVATHGSFWDYDRRVPILFWWPGVQPFEQPLGVETVDIMPTLAALLRLPVDRAEIDGRCLDLDAGDADSCAVR